ncbi:PREDICTED: uncharacterized protein LOC109221653 [Nicotiana attenuata]|uniref:uncharacterized protein LOC109221653 n=1 Tax=Nicotiana attenuata TaxID=49451 RepID=UPI000904F788|nr:PREDICTED: uncharacterized protein LOC109221653 [Nicotiana attenuata]
MSSSNPNPKIVPILDSFPNAPARYRRGRGSVLRGTGSVRGGTSGFAIRGMSAEVAITLRASSSTPLALERTQATLSKRKVVEEDSDVDEDEDTSLTARPRTRRRIVFEDETEISPARISEPVTITSDEETIPRDSPESTHRLFIEGVEVTNLIGTELMGRIFLLEKKARESDQTFLEAERIAREAQLEATNWKEQFKNAQKKIKDLQENKRDLEQQKQILTSELAGAKASSSKAEKDKERLECSFLEQLSKSSEEIRELKVLLSKKEEYAGELVKNLSQAQADLQISSDKARALEDSRASLEATLDSTLAENQMLKNDLASWERNYELLEENFNTEVSWAFLNSRRDALTEASQENFDLESELAKVLRTIEMTQQPLDFPSPANETPVAEEPFNEGAASVEVENVTIPAPEGETSLIQTVEAEAPVTLAPLGDLNTSSPTAATSSEIATVPTAAPENEVDIATSEVPTPLVTS